MGAATVTSDKLVYAKSVGIDCIEVSINQQASQSTIDFIDGDAAMITLLSDIKTAADNADIQIWSIHMPYGSSIDLSLIDEAAREKVVALQKKAIRMLAVLQPKYILFHPSHYLGLNERQARINQLVASIKEIKPVVDSIGAHILIENLLGPELLKDATHERPLCRTVEESLSIMSLMDDDVFFVADLNHIKHPENLILAMGSRLKSLHVSDGDGEVECHYLPCYDLGGTVDWTAVLTALNEVDYQGPFLYELHSYNDLTDLPQCYCSLYQSCWGQSPCPTATLTSVGNAWVYRQDFDSLASTNATVNPKYHTFLRGKTLAGWYACSSQNATNTYKADNGSYYYGTSLFSYGGLTKQFGGTGQTDRAMGSVCSAGGYTNFGVLLYNNTGATVNDLTIQYAGEAWKQGTESNKSAGGLVFSFYKNPAYYVSSQVGDGSTTVPSLGFTPPCTGASDDTDVKVLLPLDGNVAANRTVISGKLTGLSWSVGETLLLRWKQDVATSTSLTAQWGLAVDDLTITVEETATALPAAISAQKMSLYRSGDSVWLKATPGEWLEVYTIIGQLAKRMLLSNEYTQIDGLQKGMLYLLRVGNERRKIVI
jgi:sugar phosphate isomerase/epimerase